MISELTIFDLLMQHHLSMRVQPHQTVPPATPAVLWTASVIDDRVVGRGCGSASYATPIEAVEAALRSFVLEYSHE